MNHGFGKRTLLLLAGILLLVLACALPAVSAADATGSISGSTAATTTFDVSVTGSGSGYIKLFATKGSAYAAGYDSNGNLTGYKSEDAFGFFKVDVTKPGYSQSYVWAPSATVSRNGMEKTVYLVVVFPSQGDYQVTVTPMTQSEINGNYWAQNRFQSWTKHASWIINKAVNCQCSNASTSGGGSVQPQPQPQPGNAVVTVYCYDTVGNYLRAYTETITASGMIYPQAISGYTAVTTGGQYITYYGNGSCSPNTVTFRYQKNQTSGTVTVYCYDTAGSYIRSYTEQITYSKMLYAQNINGYTAPTGGQYITYNGGVCNPSTVTFTYQKTPTYGTVTVNCTDIAGNFIRSYTEQVTYSRMLYPQNISGYSTPSGGQYVTYINGVCSPSTVTFTYQKVPTAATLTVNCYDSNGAYIRSYTQTITSSTTVYPQNISGYKSLSGGQYVTYSNGACSPNTLTFNYERYASSADVTVNCVDLNGTLLDSYTETITFSKTVSPKAITGYNIASGGQYVSFSNGACTPNTITFKYQKVAEPATLNIDCYDTNGNYIRSYTETLTSSRTVYPQAISGYTIVSGGQVVTYSDGACSPSKLTFNYQKIPTPASVTIRCIDNNGSVIRTYTETVTASKTITPPAISGYTALSSAQQVTFTDGACSPNQIDFQYQIGSSVTPGSNPRVAYPTSWDTQFKPGTAKEGNGNENQVVMLSNIADDNASTVFGWIWWSSESDPSKDTKYPELTAYFDGATVSSIGIRNGNQSSGASTYKKYARPKRFFVKIYDTSGNKSEFTMDIPDQYSGDYREFPLGRTYENVSRIEFWIAGYYNGDSSKHVIYIADIQFYK